MSDISILIVPFLFGAAIGSFLNVCIRRIPAGSSIVYPPSSCPECKNKIAFYDNIPIVSFLILMGRCRSCGTPISIEYPVVEAITALFASALFYTFGLSLELFVYFAFICALIVITFIDLRLQIIPDVISLPGIGAGLAASFVLPYPGVLNSVIGLILGGGVLFSIATGYYVIAKREGMGGGDIKLLSMIGAFLGWKGALVALLAGSFLGAVIGGALMFATGKDSRYAIPFGPFLCSGAIIYLFCGDAIIQWYVLRVWPV